MKKICLLLIIFFTQNINLVSAQDIETEAKVIYGKAEDSYNEGNYKDALSKISQVEQIFESPNAKVLYLKAKTLHQLILLKFGFQNEYEITLNKFFEVVNKETFSIEKYTEMVELNLDWKELKVQLKSEEFQLYQKILNIATPEVNLVENFNSQFPNSNYIKELQEDLRKKTNSAQSINKQKLEHIKNEFDKISNVSPHMDFAQLNSHITLLNNYLISYPNSEYSSSIESKLNENKNRKDKFLTLTKKYCELNRIRREKNRTSNICLVSSLLVLPLLPVGIIIKVGASKKRKEMSKIEADLISQEFIIDDLKKTPCLEFD